jgi:hypothetical protein
MKGRTLGYEVYFLLKKMKVFFKTKKRKTFSLKKGLFFPLIGNHFSLANFSKV